MIALIACLAATSPSGPEAWTGEFTFVIRGEGKQTARGKWPASWKVLREAKGTYRLEKMVRGSVIARTPDSRNEARYESWLPTQRTAVRMRIDDVWRQRCPLFSPNEIISDVTTFRAPGKPEDGDWTDGEMWAGPLQIDHQAGTYTLEFPAITCKARRTFGRDFVEGPAGWKAKKPLREDTIEIGYDMFSQVGGDRSWSKLKGAFKPGQTEIVVSRKFPKAFYAVLGPVFSTPWLGGELSLVLRKGDDRGGR